MRHDSSSVTMYENTHGKDFCINKCTYFESVLYNMVYELCNFLVLGQFMLLSSVFDFIFLGYISVSEIHVGLLACSRCLSH